MTKKIVFKYIYIYKLNYMDSPVRNYERKIFKRIKKKSGNY